MALTLADASRLAPLEGAIDPEFEQWRQANEIAGTSEVGKGWRSAGLGSRANALYTQSLKAAAEGDAQNAEVLRQQAEDLDQQTAAWAPRVQNVSDVRSLRDAADWGAGVLGNVRTSVAPAVGSLVGAGVGLAAAPFTAGVVNPVNAGFAGGAIAGYDAETEEAVAAAMRDPYIMANHTPAEILAASRIKGGLNSLLEAAVPTVMGGKVMGTMGKGAVGKFFGRAATKAELTAAQAAERAGQRAIVDGGRMGATKAVGASTLEGGVGEFGTEFPQSLVGQGTQNYLQDKGVTDDLDYMQALNEGAAGAVVGGGMGVVGGGGEVARAHMANTKDAVAKVARDPVGAAADFVADAGHTVGKVGAKFTDVLERLASPDQRAFDTLLGAATPEQHAAAATQWAQHVLNDKDSSEAARAAAADYVTRVANGDPKAASVYRDQLTINHYESKQVENDTAEAEEIAKRLGQGSKSSKVRAMVKENPEGKPWDVNAPNPATIPASTEMDMAAEFIKPDFSRQQLETVADIWRKQGVAEKLIKATSNVTDQAQREKTMQMFGWIANGFKDDTGELFVPEWTVRNNGEKVGDVILSAAKVAFQQGLIGHDVAKLIPQITEMAKKQYADNTLVRDNVVYAIPKIARSMWAPHADQLVEVLRYAADHGTTEAQEKWLLNIYGSKENIAQAMSKFNEAKSPYGKQLEVEAGAPNIDEEGNVSASTDDYESGLSETTPASKVRFQGVGANNVPFNTLYSDKKASHDTLLSTYKNQQGAFARSVGVYDALKEQYGKDHPYMREAENEVLWNAVKKVKSSNAERDAYMAHLESLTPEQRESQLKALNKTHKLLRVEEQGGNEVADKITPDEVEGFREKRGARSEKVTPADGMMYLERKAQTDKETGEQIGADEDFLTSTHRLIQHTYDTEARESEGRTKGSAGRGVKGEYEALLRGLAALVASDGTFTARVGFRATPESEVVYRATTDKLPKQLKLRSGTVEDANTRAKSEMKAGQPMNFTLREVVSSGAKREELRRLSKAKNVNYPLQQEVDSVLASKSSPAVEALYDRLYAEWNKVDAELGEVIPETTDKDLTPTEFANEPEMYRDSDGQRKGLGVDASGYEGGRSSNKARDNQRQVRKGDKPYGKLTDGQVVENARRKAEAEKNGTKYQPIYPDGKGELAGVEYSEAAAEPISAPLATTHTPDRINTFPFDKALQDKLVADQAERVAQGGSAIDLRAPNDKERGFINAALRNLARRGLGGALAQIAHVTIFTKSEHNALFMGWPDMVKGAAIGLNARTLSILKPGLFTDIPSQVRYIIAHEVGHNLDLGSSKAASLSTHAGFEMGEKGAVGALAKEMEAAARDESNAFHKLLIHTPFKPEYAGRLEAAQRELFAQAYAMHALGKKQMAKHLPLTFAHMEVLYGRDGRRSETGVNTERVGTQSNSNSTIQRGNNTGAGESQGVRTGRAVGDERTGTGRAARDQLQQYIEQFGDKNAVFKGAALRALAANQATAIGKKLEEARKQFGELGEKPTDSTDSDARDTGRSEGILSAKELDDAIYNEDYSKLDSVAKLQQFATYTRDLATRFDAREEAGEELSTRDERMSIKSWQLVLDAKDFIKNPGRTGLDYESFFDGVEHTDEDVSAFVKALAGVKQSTQTAQRVGGVTLPKTSPFTAKDQVKSDKATKFIGRGSPKSSSAAYAQAWGALANTGSYDASDRVFVSVEGARNGRVSFDKAELNDALDAGATIIADDRANRERSYNVGERELAAYLEERGYVEKAPGEWSPRGSKTFRETTPEQLEEAGHLYRNELVRMGAEDASAAVGVKQSRMSADIHNDLGKPGFAATHDSPIRHEGKFDWRKHKGKGEGNAAFGAGTYLSTADGVHQSYKKQFTGQIIGDPRFQGLVPQHVLKTLEAARTLKPNAKLSDWVASAKHTLELNSGNKDSEAILSRIGFKELTNNQSLYEKALTSASPTYHVSVNAQPDELLDWNKPLSEQSDLVEEALRDKVVKNALGKWGSLAGGEESTGATLYNALKMHFGSQDKASDYLQSLGIVGHRYASSAGNDDAHPNYVIYDDSRIETSYVHFSSQTANDGTGKRATKAERDAAKQHILDTIGDTVKSAFVKHFGDNSSGSWTPGETQNVIRLALNGNVLSTSYHESMHEFFAMLKKYGNTATVKLLERVASNEILNRKLERLLADHPEAAAQVRESPEEAAAFLYQFWRAGQVKLGEETTGFFQKIKNLFAKITGKVSQLKLDEQAAQRVLEAFSRGDFKSMNGDTAVRDASMEALRKDTEMHEKVLDNLDKAGRDFTRIAGKLFFSSEAMLKGTKNKHMVSIAEMLHQETGTARGENQGLLSAVRQHSDIWLNKLSNILTKYKPEDLELAREALSKGVPAKDRIAKEIVEKINAFNEEMYTYISSRDVRRLDPDTNKWVKVEKRKDYFTRVWDTNALQSRTAEFKERLFKYHRAELEATAKIANNEVAAFMKGDATFKDLGPAANTAVQQGFSDLEAAGKAMGRVDTHTVTAEMVADAIITRLLNAKGHADLDEGGSDIGMTPLATSVNRRSLSWINDKHFDDFKSKDITNIMTSYVSSMVKRAEYTKALGHGSEKLRTGVDKAILYEMGGDELVENAERRLPIAIRAWGRAKAAALKAGEEFTVPYPTLRSVGLVAHNVTVSSEQVHKDLAAALKHLDQGFKAIQAQEGTLGSNISAGMRSVNNVLMTYQTVRLLPLVLFSSVNDVMGIVAQGGELKDAWDALVGGMREIKLRWKDEKSQDYKALRAEGWGTVDAGSLWDTLGQAYGSSYMSGKARRFADSFFKWNGMEGWNRAMRITATSVAERALKAYQKVGFDKNDKAAKARFEELYGKNFDPKDIALDADGELDMNDVNNQAAMMRWVSSAIMSPNAAHRTTWGSDPRMASFWMLKQFAYTFHRVMLKGAFEQAKLGNYRPAAVLALGYAPVAIAADAVKEMLIPGEEPPWMQGGLDGFLAHGFDRAGVAGVPGMAYDALTSYNGPVLGALSAMGGPTVGQLTSALVDSPSSTLLGAAPLGSLLRRAAE